VTVLDSGVAAGFGYLDRLEVRLVAADIRDRPAVGQALAGCDGVVHLAAQASVPRSVAEPLEDMEANVRGSLVMLEEARAAGVRRVVFASSNAVIAGHPPPAREDLTPSPVAPYGAAKAAVEAYLLAYCRAYGLETVALRFANAYGPWSAHKTSVVASFVKAYLAGGPLRINGSGRQTRDFVHVDDLAGVVLRCLDAPAERVVGQVFQAGTGRETSLLELARLLFDAGGREVPIVHAPPTVGDVERNVSDVAHLERALDYRPRVPLADGLARTMEWFRQHGQQAER
jgi:UDP-glucose 4-epimerase